MKRFSAVLFAFALFITVASVVCEAQELPVPTTVAIFPGVTNVPYAGETFVFTTSVKLSAKFEWIGGNQIRIHVKTGPAPSGEMALAPGQTLRICWEGHDECLYDGTPPPEWTGIVETEGGFTEK
jgi:hypothetical protein